MEQTFRETITNDKIKHVLEAFKSAVECVLHGCEPDEVHIVVSRRYVAFVIDGGEVKLERDGKQLFVEVRADGCRVVTDIWDMFVLREGKQVTYSPRLALNNETFTTDTFVDYVHKGFRTLLHAAGWV